MQLLTLIRVIISTRIPICLCLVASVPRDFLFSLFVAFSVLVLAARLLVEHFWEKSEIQIQTRQIKPDLQNLVWQPEL